MLALDRWKKTWVITRWGAEAGVDAAGRVQREADTTLNVDGVVQPLTPVEIQRLAVGTVAGAELGFWTLAEMVVGLEGSGKRGDRLTWKGTAYEIKAVTDQTERGFLDHRKYILTRVNQ